MRMGGNCTFEMSRPLFHGLVNCADNDCGGTGAEVSRKLVTDAGAGGR